MSTNQTRKPSAATESFITALAILFFASLAILFMWLDNRKRTERQTQHADQTVKDAPMTLSGNETKPPAPDQSRYSSGWDENMERIVNPHGENIANLMTSHGGGTVSPPLPLLDVAPQNITVNAGTGQIITSRHQSVITIPPHAFVDKDGNTVSGNVQVRYREFYNYMDFFLSGIPMHYDDGNAQLESAGMVEFTAWLGDEPLYVNPERKISMMMATLTNSPGYNLYYYDKQQKKWIDKGASVITVSAERSQSFRVENVQEDSVEKKFSFNFPSYRVQLHALLEYGRKRKFVLAKKAESDKLTFHFIGSEHTVPMLNDLRTITWKYIGPDATTEFEKLTKDDTSGRNRWITPRSWDNATIHPVKEDGTYLLTLFDGPDSVSLRMIPRFTTERSVARFTERLNAFLDSQEERLTSQEISFQKFRQDTTAYFASSPRWVKRSVTSAYTVMRQFQMDGFGIWNCDRPIQLPQASVVNACFADENNRPVHPMQVYLADKSLNTVYTYDEQTLHQFKFNPYGQNLVWAIFPGDIIVVIKPKEFRDKYAQSKSVCKFVVEVNKNAVVSQQDLKKQLVFDM